MPWLETSPVDQRERFIRDHQLGLYTLAELCARYDISRKTGYKWLARFDEAGRRGLQDRSRAPPHCPHRLPDEVADVICAARRQHLSWGPAKLLAWLAPRRPDLDLPAVSPAGDLLARRGLVMKRRRRHSQPPGVVPIATHEPNDLWTADFKGHFRTRDGVYCYPLTVADQPTRYLLACHGLPSTKGHGARPVFDRLFREDGLPRAIRTDNGVPFATTGLHGLSQLNVWWRRLGIQHQRIPPASPQQNGAHERMPKTVTREAIRPPPRQSEQPAARLHCFPPPLQRGTAPRVPQGPYAGLRLSHLSASVHGPPAPDRISRALPREEGDLRGHRALQPPAALPQPRPRAPSRRLRGGRRRCLVDPLLRRAPRPVR